MAMGILRYDSLKIFIFVGAGIFLFGLIRFLTLKKLMKNIALNDDPAVDDNPVLKESFSWRNLVDSQENLQESDDKKEKNNKVIFAIA